MKTIEINDLNESALVSAQEAADVKGGPIYMKYDGIDGSVTTRTTSAGGVNVCFGDGSVRF